MRMTKLLLERDPEDEDWPDYINIAPYYINDNETLTIEETLNKYGWFKRDSKENSETWKNGLKNLNINQYGVVAWFGDCDVNGIYATPQRLTPKDLELALGRYKELKEKRD